tara:strand:- start:3151 stop:3495 length:345 start_codon:yes stop_codon:yes gene_type:complete
MSINANRNSNKRGPFKNNSAKKLALLNNLTSAAIITNNKLISIDDVQWLLDNINYDKNGVAIYNKKNVPPEKRYDTNWIAYTKNEFYFFYGENYKFHWNKGTVYKPLDMIELVD